MECGWFAICSDMMPLSLPKLCNLLAIAPMSKAKTGFPQFSANESV
jgi:hypothetical protein